MSEHSKKVLNICYKFTSDHELSRELSQEVFIEVFRSMETFRNESDISTWIYRIAVNKSLDELKRQKRARRFAELKSIFNKDVQNASDLSDPHSLMEESERWIILNKALESLPERQRRAITLSRIESLSGNEIAGILNCNVSAVNMLITRAKKNLRKILSRHFDKIFFFGALVFLEYVV